MNATRRIEVACRVFVLPLLIASSAAAIQIDSFDAPSPQAVVAIAADGTVTIDGPRSGTGIVGVRTVTKNGNAFEAGDSISVGDGALTVVSQPFFAEDCQWRCETEPVWRGGWGKSRKGIGDFSGGCN